MALTPSLSIFRHQGYRHYWIARQLISFGRQMIAVAIGWQVYDLARETRSIEESAFLLGIVGLVQFLPVLLLSLVGGQAADRFNRKLILIISTLVRMGAILALIMASSMPTAIALPSIFVAAAVMGCVNAFTPAASNSLYPRLVPREELPQAIAWNSLGYQIAAILGPAFGGFLYIGGPALVYGSAMVISIAAVLNFLIVRAPKHEPDPRKRAASR